MADELRNETQRETVEEFLKLSLEEQRRRISLRPAYLDVANEIVQPDRVTVQTSYFWRRWAPKLGPIASVLLLRLRRCCARNRDVGYGAAASFPTQEELLREIGIDRHRLTQELRRLERLGFVRRERSFRSDRRTGQITRCPDEYRVIMDDPIAPEDVADLFARAGERIANGSALSQLELTTQTEAADSAGSATLAHPKRRIPPNTEAADSAQRVLNALSTNVDVKQKRGQTDGLPVDQGNDLLLRGGGFARVDTDGLIGRLVSRGAAPSDSPATVLATEISISLGDPGSIRFYLRVARALPESLIRQALSETLAAQRERRLRGRAGAFFTGAIRGIAKEAGLAL